jgi:hypothetical protein
MTWALKPVIPDSIVFGGEMVYPSTNIEIPDTFRNYVEHARFEVKPQFINKMTGFETKKYKTGFVSEAKFSIMLVGNLPRWLQQSLHRLAISMNGAGMVLQFKDNWISGTDASPVTYECRWNIAGDFVDNSELLCGGSMELHAFGITAQTVIAEFQKVINIPTPDLQWDYQIDDSAATEIYYRVK